MIGATRGMMKSEAHKAALSAAARARCASPEGRARMAEIRAARRPPMVEVPAWVAAAGLGDVFLAEARARGEFAAAALCRAMTAAMRSAARIACSEFSPAKGFASAGRPLPIAGEGMNHTAPPLPGAG